MSRRIMSDLDVSSSDEEIFDSSPLTKSTNTSLNSISPVKQIVCNDAIKDVSVKITQLPLVNLRENKKTTQTGNTNIKKKKKVIRKWEKGIIVNKHERKRRKFKLALKLAANKAKGHAQNQLQINEGKSTDVHQKLQVAQFDSESLEMSDKKDTKFDQTFTSARILPYNFYKKKMYNTGASFNSSFLSNENTEQTSSSFETHMSDMSEETVSSRTTYLQKLHHELLELKKCAKKTLDEQVVKINDDTSESDSSMELQPILKKRRRRISSSDSENIINNNNHNKSDLFCEETEQAKSQKNMQINQEVRVVLTKLEDMIAMNFKQNQSKEDASEISEYKSPIIRQQSNTEKTRKPSTKPRNEKENSYLIEVKSQKTGLECQNNEVILRNDGSSQIEDISKNSRLPMVSRTCLQKNCLKQLDNLQIKKLRKKYKLFKKPRVLLIKLETLQIFVKNGKYSASEIERLMKKYINFVMKSNCLFMSCASYGFKQLRNDSTDVNIDRTTSESASSSSASNNSTEFAEKSSRKDKNKIAENNSSKNTLLQKFPLCSNFMSMIPIDQYNLLQLPKDNSVLPKKKRDNPSSQELLKIWQNAFCKLSTRKSQKTAAKQSASLQSMSQVRTVSRNPSKSVNTKCRSVFNPVASTSLSSVKDYTSIISSKTVVSPNNQAKTAVKSADCNENVFESPIGCINLPSNESVGKTVSKNDLSSLENSRILKNLLLDDTEDDIDVVSQSSLDVRRKLTEKASPGSLSQEKSSIISPVRETKSPKISQIPWLSCETTQITFRCAKCNIAFGYFREWQEHQNVCKRSTIAHIRFIDPSFNALKQQNFESLNPPMSQNSTVNTKSNPPSSKQTPEERDKVCTVCFKLFETNPQFHEHLKKHTDQHKKVYSIIDKIVATSQKTDKQDDQASTKRLEKAVKVIGNELKKRSLDNTCKLNAERRITSEVSHDASNQRNETLSETTEQNKQRQLIPATRETKEKEDYTDEEMRQMRPVAICKCHRNVKVTHGETVPIEIVLQCTCCRVLFRLLECFEAHCKSSEFLSCSDNSQNNRKAKLFCNICQVMMNSLKDMYRHLITHSKINRKSTVSFRCNICKVSFYALGPLFNDHYTNHAKSPCFRSLEFTPATYVGSKLIKIPTAYNDKEMSIYYEVADHMCPKCKTPFYTPLTLRMHIVTCQGNFGIVSNNASSSVMNVSLNKKMFILICGFCNKKFHSKAIFEQHSLEHKQKRELSSYYTHVSVTAVTKVFICKICTSMWQSLEKFEEHWRTHGRLREDYVCSICDNHFDAFDLFEKHAITHQQSVSCKVIYCDVNEQASTTSQSDNNPFSEDPSKRGEKPESDQQITLLQKSMKKRLYKNNRSEIITVSDDVFSSGTTQSTGANAKTVRAKDCTKIDNSAGNKRENRILPLLNSGSNGNNNLEESDEENLVITLSDEESTVSTTTAGNATENVPLIQHTNTEKRVATSNAVATVEQRKQSTDMESVVSSAETFCSTNVTSESSSVRLNITQKEATVWRDVSADVSGNKGTNVGDANVRDSTRDNDANDTTHPVIINVVSLNENSKDTAENDINSESMKLSEKDKSTENKTDASNEPKESSKTDRSTENKTFLRVKSLAELTNTPLESHICYKCGQPFDCVNKLTEHIIEHDAEERKQAFLLGNARNAQHNVPILPKQTQESAPQSKAPQLVVCSNSNQQQQQHPILSSASRQYQVIGVRPLHLVAYNVENKTVRPNMLQREMPLTPQQKNTCAVVQPPVTQLPVVQHPTCSIPYPTNKQQTTSIQRTTSIQQQPQQSTVAVRPFIQNQGSVLSLHQQRHQLHLTPQQLQHLTPQQQRLLQQSQQHQQHQQQLQQHQILQEHQQLQHQQLQHNNIACNQYLVPQRNVSYPLAQNNTMLAINNINASENLNMTQQAKTPENLTCLYCPGFETASIADFEAHLRSPKHEARSHYNDVPYMS